MRIKAYLEAGEVVDALTLVDYELGKCDASSLSILASLYYLRGKIFQRSLCPLPLPNGQENNLCTKLISAGVVRDTKEVCQRKERRV